jgi:hypothetical protein
MPGEKGASTLTCPGDISSYTHLRFLICATPALTNERFMIILETYPGPNYSRLFWNYNIPAGNTFQEVRIDLRHPDLVENQAGAEIETLLKQTRFLFFYFYAETSVPKTLNASVDDIALIGVAPPIPTPVGDLWMLF